MSEQEPLTETELDAIDAWWRAANYLSVGQIYLMANPLLTEPLRPEHVKTRLLGHWGPPGPQPGPHPPQPRHQGPRAGRPVHLGPRPRRPRRGHACPSSAATVGSC